ncbi:MAG: hypothetical protein AAF250_07390 [Pseudomonadota bacterium]
MHMHPAIAALRGNRASQQHAQAPLIEAAKTWRESDFVQTLANELAAYAEGADLAGCTALSTLLSDHKATLDWVREWSATMIAPLREQPLGEMPMRCHHSGEFSTIQLLTHGRARLSLYAFERHTERPMADIALWADRESSEVLLCGSARGTLHTIAAPEAGDASVETSHYEWRAGQTMALSPSQARQFLAIDETLLVLQVSRAAPQPRPTQERRVSDGHAVKSASGDKQASRDVMALAVLGALEYQPALDAMGDVASSSQRDPDLRWEAVRQALSLDPARGVAILSRLASDQDDPLHQPAQNLHAQLLAAHPQLANLPLENA